MFLQESIGGKLSGAFPYTSVVIGNTETLAGESLCLNEFSYACVRQLFP